jgi:hypothetical protein
MWELREVFMKTLALKAILMIYLSKKEKKF